MMILCQRFTLEIVSNELFDDSNGCRFKIMLKYKLFDQIVNIALFEDDNLRPITEIELHIDYEKGFFVHVTVKG